jgi:hypothetical protein
VSFVKFEFGLFGGGDINWQCKLIRQQVVFPCEVRLE